MSHITQNHRFHLDKSPADAALQRQTFFLFSEANFVLTDDVVSGNITVLFLLSSSEHTLLQRARFSKFRILVLWGIYLLILYKE